MSVFFNGQELTTPVTASVVNDDAMLNQNLSVGNAIAFVGISEGGHPQKVLAFSNPAEAKRTLVSGELCDAVVAAFAPSSQTGAPQTVYAVRVNDSTPAFASLLTPSGKRFGVLEGLTYSPRDKQVAIEVKPGVFSLDENTPLPTPGVNLVDLIVTYPDKNNNLVTVKGEHVNMSPLMLDIKEDNTSLAITATSFHLIMEDILPARKEIDVSFLDFPKLGDMVAYINGITNSTGKHPFDLTLTMPETDSELPSNIFDENKFKTKGTIYVSANGWFISNWLNDKLAGVAKFAIADLSLTAEGLAPIPQNFLTQPKNGVPYPEHWQTAFDLLQTKDVQWVQAVSGDEVVHAKVNAHCITCSNVLRKERRTICGTKSGISNEDAIKAAKGLNSPRASLVHIGHYAYDNRGKLSLRPAYMTAGLIAAAFAGSNPGTPMTNKLLNVQGLERDLVNPTETDVLLKGGVLPVENTETGYKVTQSISTWLADSKYNNREQSCGVAVDFAIRNVRQALDVLRGQKQSPILLSRAVSITKGVLTELARPEPQGPAVLVGNEKSPAWRNVSATIEGDVLRIQFEASPAIPNNYILVTMYAVPYSGSATA
ncbi:hypothetical protein D7B12_17850 [Salmonella enterica]|nr:hypothetical protein [Salmonella enterica]